MSLVNIHIEINNTNLECKQGGEGGGQARVGLGKGSDSIHLD